LADSFSWHQFVCCNIEFEFERTRNITMNDVMYDKDKDKVWMDRTRGLFVLGFGVCVCC